jgi:16S rRNA C967 or C1407 C5-methylase (RsmB/RsmF family)
MNTIVTRKDGIQLCSRLLRKSQLRFDKILVDAPCSGEGTLRKSPKTYMMWNRKVIDNLSRLQKRLASEALKLLKVNGEMIYSTCTLSPEEDEEVVDFLMKNFDIEVQEVVLPFKMRCGVCEWENKKYSEELKRSCRVYPQDNDTDGFFLCKIKKLSDKCLLRERE